MKTDDLIGLLARDTSPPRPFRRVLAAAAVAAVLSAGGVFFAVVGFRPDIMAALGTDRFLLKLAVMVVLAVAATGTALNLGRPDARLRASGLALAFAPALLLGAVAVELTVVPRSQWLPQLVGSNARFCLTLIPFLSVGPLACLLAALRRGAPSSPGAAGAVAGLAAGGIAAVFYATNCNDDSPLFVITWYPIAIAAVMTAGCLIGRRMLRW